MSIEIKALGASDIDLMEELNTLFGHAFEEPEHYIDRRPSRDYLERMLGRQEIIALVALEEGEVSAGLVAYELHKLEQQRSEIYTYDLAVRQSSRRQGQATALLRRTQEIAHERGAWVVYVQADMGDDPAVALYSGLGEREEVLHFDLPPIKIAREGALE